MYLCTKMTHDSDTIIAHLRKDDRWVIQTNAEHSTNVAILAAQFAGEFGMHNWGWLAGLLHDRGKEKRDFQRYIRVTSGFDPSAGSYADKSHAMAGALVLHQKYPDKCMLLTNIIAGHHRGLYDLSDLQSVMSSNEPPTDIDHTVNMPLMEKLPKDFNPYADTSHLTRMLFSCLVDADWLDTGRFMQPAQASLRGNYDDMVTLREKFDRFCRRFSDAPDTQLNRLRTHIQNLCIEAASLKPGFFELTVPTGGGKTIASVMWALHHAIAHGKKRIIVAIPFTSIIVQTARILRDIFGDHNVVEHHSVVDEAHADEYSRLACENWDAPIIVTTNVQLFESMFSNRPARCRKLHSLCDSVVILDEVQALPLPYLQPIVDAMESYARCFSVSFLFCTASQPILSGKRKGSGMVWFNGIDSRKIRSIMPPDEHLHDKLRRVRLDICAERISIESLAAELSRHDRVLCIVNTRAIAAEVFSTLPPDENNFHLSRTMCSAHLADTLELIRRKLSDTSVPVRVISTQLIEAGVDIDFPVVFRQMAGLDSLLQAAGRCNREGRLPSIGITHVFELDGYIPSSFQKFPYAAMQQMLSGCTDRDWFSPDVMTEFYRKLYSKTCSFDDAKINNMASCPTEIRYEEIDRKFQLIDDHGQQVIVNYGDAPRLVEQLRLYGPSLSLTRKLSLYTVSINRRLFEEFDKAGLIEYPYPGFNYIPLSTQYDHHIGLKVSNQYLEQSFVIS